MHTGTQREYVMIQRERGGIKTELRNGDDMAV